MWKYDDVEPAPDLCVRYVLAHCILCFASLTRPRLVDCGTRRHEFRISLNAPAIERPVYTAEGTNDNGCGKRFQYNLFERT